MLMMLLALTTAHAARWSGPTCSEIDTKSVPRGEKVVFDADDPPRNLVPRGYHRQGLIKPRGTWIDERGRRYTFRQVETILLSHPIAAAPYRDWRKSRSDSFDVEFELVDLLPEATDLIPEPMGSLYRFSEWHTDWGGMSGFHRSVCLFNLAQPEFLDEQLRQERRITELAALRGGEGPPLSVWAFVDQLYEAAEFARPEPEQFRADVQAAWAAIQGGLSQDALRDRATTQTGDSLADRLTAVD